MKKTVLFISVIVLLAVSAISVSASGSIDIAYGNGKLNILKIESFTECEIPASQYGDMYCDGMLGLFSQNIVDRYCITMPEAAKNAEAFKNAKYVIIKFKNLSDGDIYFCYQPSTDGGVNSSFIYSVGDEPIRLVSADGFVSDAVFTDAPSVNNRYAITVPVDFDGCIIIPLEDIVMHGTWESVWIYGKSVITHSGFHASYIDGESTFVEAEITGLYCASELAVTEGTATTATAAETDKKSGEQTSANTSADTAAFTTSEQTDKIETPTGINTTALYIITGACAAAVVIFVIIIVIKKKKY